MIRSLAERRFDGAIIFTSFRQSPLPAAYLSYLAGIPLRAAASLDGPGSLLTTRLKRPEKLVHEVERGLDLARALGMTSSSRDLVLTVPDDARDTAFAALAARGVACGRPLVVVHPGCSMPARAYPWELFAGVIDLLVERLGAIVLLTGVRGEAELVDRIIAAIPASARRSVHAVAGELSFPAFCALIEAADLAITNNTGPMHVAAALKTPVVALFALTNPPEQWGPWQVPHRLLNHDVPCRICYERVCPYGHECLTLVSPEAVVDAASDLLAGGVRRAGNVSQTAVAVGACLTGGVS
jgi:ADP-heptose:LPS heptosyltransferase